MKGAWCLIVLGVLFVVDGTVRVVLGWMFGQLTTALSGIATGWLLGSAVLFWGLAQRKKIIEQRKEAMKAK